MIRCTECRGEFPLDLSVSRCPSCGSTGVPMDMARDMLVRINWHELRILCIWATWYAGEKFPGQGSEKALQSIVRALMAQRPDPSWPALTFAQEIGELPAQAAATGVKVGAIEATDAGGKRIVIPEPGQA